MRRPGITPGSPVTQLTGNMDYASTFAEIAGIPIPPSNDQVDGRSLLGLMHRIAPPSWRQALLLEHKPDPHGGGGLGARGKALRGIDEPAGPFELPINGDNNENIEPLLELRTGPYTYVHYETTGEYELYYNVDDPSQFATRFITASDELKTSLANWLNCLKSTKGETLRRYELASQSCPELPSPRPRARTPPDQCPSQCARKAAGLSVDPTER